MIEEDSRSLDYSSNEACVVIRTYKSRRLTCPEQAINSKATVLEVRVACG